MEYNFSTLEQRIRNRKVHVMLEEDLNCDALTDHLEPKDIFPLFEQFFFQAKTALMAPCLPVFLELSQKFEQDIQTNLKHQCDEEIEFQTGVTKACCDQLLKLHNQLGEKQREELADVKQKLRKITRSTRQQQQIYVSGPATVPKECQACVQKQKEIEALRAELEQLRAERVQLSVTSPVMLKHPVSQPHPTPIPQPPDHQPTNITRPTASLGGK